MDSQDTNGNGYFKGNINARVTSLENNVDKILTNHLPHIQDTMGRMEEKIDRVSNGINEKFSDISMRIAWWALGIIGTIFVGMVLFFINNR